MSIPLFMNAAGLNTKTVEQVQKLAEVPNTTHVVSGSWTVKPRAGNGELSAATYVAEDGTTVNSLGLPNGGIDYLLECLPKMQESTSKHGKRLVISISAAEENAEFVALAGVFHDYPKVIIELNLACPNIWKGEDVLGQGFSTNKGVLFFDMRESLEVVSWVRRVAPNELWVKVAPCTDVGYMREMAKGIGQAGVNKIVAVNTLPGTRLYMPSGQPALKVTGGLGGMAGSGLHTLALHNAAYYVEVFGGANVIGVGGIDCFAWDQNFLRRGVAGTQVGSAFFFGDVSIFHHIKNVPNEGLYSL
jgi:dihydroorotate dehydrogenase